MDAERLWDDVCRRLESRVSAHDRECWLAALTPCELRDGRLVGEVPSALHAEQIRTRFGVEIDSALREAGTGARLALSVNPSRGDRPRPRAPRATAPFGAEFTFDRFVVGESNALAHRAARDLAEKADSRYAPLFLFGGVGLGKTHLLRAFGNAVCARTSAARVRLLTGEEFTNDLIRALRGDQAEKFRARFRDVDVLIVDDVQFLAGKERTQDEFFHTFDALRARGKTLVLASDQPPRDIRHLESRLRSRFESGWMADVRRPDRRLRRAIVERKSRELGLAADGAVFEWIADRIVGNVRELEGALRRLAAAQALDPAPLDVARAERWLRPILRPPTLPTIADVKRLVAERFHVREEDMLRRRRSAAIVLPRQVAMCLARRRTSSTYAEIAAEFGGRNHTTVVSAVKAVEQRCREDGAFSQLLDGLDGELCEA